MINIICLKHGIKYGPMYVNNLKSMIDRHLTLPHRFVCFTENIQGINPNIEIKPLPNIGLTGWWWKPYMFKKDLFPEEDVNFFIDLDMVIVSNIDKLFLYMPNKFCGLEDPGRVWGRNKKLGSAILRWPSGKFSDIWEKLEKNTGQTTQFPGDQDWIWHLYKDQIEFYPHKWIMSYKWEIRSKKEIIGIRSESRFKDIKRVDLDTETAVLAFHGYPQPHQVQDPIIVNNWL